MQYREYQQQMHDDIYSHWQSNRNVLSVLPTGGGKTVVMAGIINQWPGSGNVVAIAHRKELVAQIALALGACGIPHSIIGPKETMKHAVQRQRLKLGTHFHSTSAKVAVASVDTLITPARKKALKSWSESVSLWVIDEAHHVVRGNKWGTAVEMFPNAHGLGFTATPCRADGKGLGVKADGVFDVLTEGPTMRDLINNGFLCDYRIFAPTTYMPLSKDDIGASGDYSRAKLKAAAKRSCIVGDVVVSYERYCQGKSTVVFAPDLETAGDMCNNFNAAGIKAAVVSSETSDAIRSELLDRFERGDLDVIINVDLLGEGFDCPGIEAVIMARKTESYGLYSQQFGRALRILEGKIEALIIDHVGNVKRHGLPDAARIWSLDAREKRPSVKNPDDDIPLKYCPECTQPYHKHLLACPFCGHWPKPASRSGPEFVDGDLFEIDPAVLAAMRGEVAKVDEDPLALRERLRHAHMDARVAGGIMKRFTAKQEMQKALRAAMAWWGGVENQKGLSDREAQKKFYLRFGVDVMTAQTLGKPEAIALADRIAEDISNG